MSGSILTTETVGIQRVGAAIPTFDKTAFVYRGKPGDTFNTSNADKVVVTNAGPNGSLLYLCKRGVSGACNPTLAGKYGVRNAQGQFTNKPIGAGGVGNETFVVTNPAGAKPACPTNPALAQNADFTLEYKVDAAAPTTQRISVTVRCTSLTFAWNNGKSSFGALSDDCAPPQGFVTVNSNVAVDRSLFIVKIDGIALNGQNSFVGTTATAGRFFVAANNFCNYSVGTHTLSVDIVDPDDSTKLLSTISSPFTVTDNRWTMAVINNTNNCPNASGIPIDVVASTPSAQNQIATNVPVGAAAPTRLIALAPYTITTYIAGTTTQTGRLEGFVFPKSLSISLPINFGPSSAGTFNSYVDYSITLVCPGARSTSAPKVVLTPMTPWTFPSSER